MTQERKRWMEASEVIPMFPSLVWKIQLEAGLRDSLNSRIVAALAEMRRELPPLEAGRGWQSGQALHQRGELRELAACVDRGVTSILRFLHIGQGVFKSWGSPSVGLGFQHCDSRAEVTREDRRSRRADHRLG